MNKGPIFKPEARGEQQTDLLLSGIVCVRSPPEQCHRARHGHYTGKKYTAAPPMNDMRLREVTRDPRQVEFNRPARPYPLNEGHRTALIASVRVLLPCSLIGRSKEGNESNLGSVTDSNLELLSMTCK